MHALRLCLRRLCYELRFVNSIYPLRRSNIIIVCLPGTSSTVLCMCMDGYVLGVHYQKPFLFRPPKKSSQ